MPKETLKYSKGELTVVWKPKQCIHSTLCWKGLMEVFNPKERPWIRMDGASSAEIIAQVRKCPSGALSYVLNPVDLENTSADQIVSEAAQVLKVEVSANGPYLINSACLIVHSDGKQETKTGTVALCRCGASSNKPYCDGTHRKIAFRD